jgi:hypothetical protein
MMNAPPKTHFKLGLKKVVKKGKAIPVRSSEGPEVV